MRLMCCASRDKRVTLVGCGAPENVQEELKDDTSRDADSAQKDAMDAPEDFSELMKGRQKPCWIPLTSERGISLSQLLDVCRFIRSRCLPDGSFSGLGGTNAQPLQMCTLNLYNLSDLLIKPATQRMRCSYVELVAEIAQAQVPEWFVSHWWGEPVVLFVACIQRFSRLRGGRAVFWTCAYANNQHCLQSDLTADPEQSSFRQAMHLSKGTVMVLDCHANTFWRVWCTFETTVTLRDPHKVFDIVTFVVDKESTPLPLIDTCGLKIEGCFEMISDGLLPADEQLTKKDRGLGRTAIAKKAERERTFPLELMKRGLNVSIQHAKASVDSDRVHILNSIVGRGVDDLDLDPITKHPEYDAVNATLRARFAMAMLYRSLSFEKVSSDLLNLALRNLATDRFQKKMALEFPFRCHLTNEIIAELLVDLPPSLQSLSLCMQRCDQVGDGALQPLAKALTSLPDLLEFRAQFWQCPVSDDGLATLSSSLPKVVQLRSFILDLSSCHSVGDVGVKALSRGIAKLSNLAQLVLNFSSCEWVSDPGVQSLCDRLCELTQLERMSLYFSGCKWITDTGVQAIGRCLRKMLNLEELTLNLIQCEIYSNSVQSLGSGLKQLSGLRTLCLLFDNKLMLCGAGKSRAGTEPLAQGLWKLTNLEELSLNFSSVNSFVDNDAVALQGPLGHLFKLTSLKLELNGVSISSVGLSAFVSSLNQLASLGVLQKLSLKIVTTCDVQPCDIEELTKAVLRMGGLTYLWLDLPGRAFTTSNIKLLAEGLGTLSKLVDLSLILGPAVNIDDACVVPLCLNLTNLNNLLELFVKLKGTKVSPESIKKFCDELQSPEHWIDLSADMQVHFSSSQLATVDDKAMLVSSPKCPSNKAMVVSSAKSPSKRTDGFEGGRLGSKGQLPRSDSGNGFSNIPRERRDCLQKQIDEFVANSDAESISFGPGALTANERRFVHHMVSEIGGLVTHSFGDGAERNLSIFRDASVASPPQSPKGSKLCGSRGKRLVATQ